jgi:predicted transcriptional regulator
MNEEFLFLNINRGISDEDGRIFWILINTKDDKNSKKMSKYTEKEREIFKSVLDSILKNFPKTKIGEIELQNTQKTMKKSEFEYFLNRLCQENWINKSQKGKIFIGLRTIVEMKDFLISELSSHSNQENENNNNDQNDYPKCFSCKEFVVKPKFCKNCLKTETPTYLHKRCKKEATCPRCKQIFN